VRSAALRQVVDFYLHSAYAADRIIDPHAPQMTIGDVAMGVRPVTPADISAASAWLSAEHDQLLAAQRTAATQGRYEAAWQFAWVLATFHLHQGLRHEALTVWLAALDAAEQMALADATTHIRTFRLLGYAYCELGRHDEGVSYLERALELAERHGDATEQAHVHRLLTRVWGYRGDFRRALDHAERALDHFQAIEDPGQEAEALNAAGWCNAVLGEYDTARARCQAALDLFRRLQDIDGEAASLDSLGYIEHHSGRHDCAVSNYARAIALQRELGDPRNEAETLENLGHSQSALGQYRDAHETWRRAHELYLVQERDEAARRVRQQIDMMHHPHHGTG
jgi:tetratricopeptide (TPR) repeat protein